MNGSRVPENRNGGAAGDGGDSYAGDCKDEQRRFGSRGKFELAEKLHFCWDIFLGGLQRDGEEDEAKLPGSSDFYRADKYGGPR